MYFKAIKQTYFLMKIIGSINKVSFRSETFRAYFLNTGGEGRPGLVYKVLISIFNMLYLKTVQSRNIYLWFL